MDTTSNVAQHKTDTPSKMDPSRPDDETNRAFFVVENNDEPHAGPWDLPEGAEMIIRQMAAQEIFAQMVAHLLDPDQAPAFEDLAALIQAFPALVHHTFQIEWENGETRELYPLAILCCLKPTLGALQMVYNANPKLLWHKESFKGTLPIHYLCTFRASLDTIQWMLRVDPKLIQTPRKDNMFPLHLSIFFKSSPEVIDYLMKTWPESLVRDYAGDWSVLHAAVAGQQHLDLVRRIYEAHPAGILSADDRLRTALHHACWKKGNPEVVSFLRDKAPMALYMEDDDRETPLFRAARNQTAEVVQLLLPQNPPVDDLGANLLHFAAIDNTPDVVELLLERFPDMATSKTQEQDKYTPLHSACHFSDNVETIQMLVQHNPESVLVKNGHGQTPLETARQFNTHKEILAYLESVSPKEQNSKTTKDVGKEENGSADSGTVEE